ncbi:hypothetical protein Mapa_014824 [Marchantia paleacea]|nr:hypothetical protein Mapa_014824 [Marchantia paleacea]
MCRAQSLFLIQKVKHSALFRVSSSPHRLLATHEHIHCIRSFICKRSVQGISTDAASVISSNFRVEKDKFDFMDVVLDMGNERAPIEIARTVITIIAVCATFFMVSDYATMAARFCYRLYAGEDLDVITMTDP